jgi:hypothetical protein
MSKIFICEAVYSMIKSFVFNEKIGTNDDVLAVTPVTENEIDDISEKIAAKMEYIRQHHAEKKVKMFADDNPAYPVRRMEDDSDFQDLFALQSQQDKLLARVCHQYQESYDRTFLLWIN